MKICFLANPTWSHIIKWSQALTALGHDVHVVFDENNGPQEAFPRDMTLHPLKVPDYRFPCPWLFRYTLALKRMINRISPDIVHLHNLDLAGIACVLLRVKPFLVSVYGMDIVRYGDNKEVSTKKLIFKKMILHYAQRVTATSAYLAGQTQKYCRFNKQKLKIIPFGVDIEKFSKEVNPENRGVKRIGVLKDLRSEYGFKIFFDAVSVIKDRGMTFKVIIGGDGEGRKELEDYAKVLNIKDIIEFKGKIPFEEAGDFLRQMDIVVLVSVYESFGVVGLEAQSLGIPVVGVNVGGVSEIIDEGKTGLLIPPHDADAMAGAVIQLLKNDDLRQRMSAQGPLFVKRNFEWEENVMSMVRLYEDLLNDQRENA
ncbi:MAG: glycosyltransferase family 4 protein [Candidatus Omnitrophica bacterium]|nr:glycosyltransferase family 4 protein [Candidatus Omnitrophota bacterium]